MPRGPINRIRRTGRNLFIAQALLMACSLSAYAGSSGITYHGRLLEPDGVTPVTGAVTFNIQLRTPNNANCLMYGETQVTNLTGSNGVFALTIGDGTRTDSTGLTLDKVFANTGSFTFDPSTCVSSSSYTPAFGDGRDLVVTFQSSAMSAPEAMPVQALNYAPLAIEAEQVSGIPATSLLRFVKSDGTLVNTTPLNDVEYAALTALVDGTSTLYAKPGNATNGTPIYVSGTGTIASTTTGDMWLDTSVAGSDVLKINTDNGVQTIPLVTGGAFIKTVVAGTGIAVSTASGNATVSIAAGGVGTTELATGGVTGTKIATGTITGSNLDAGIVISTTGTVSAAGIGTRALTISNSQTPVDATHNEVNISAPSSPFTGYALVLPQSIGAAGQVLVVNDATTGQLGWINPSSGSVTSVTAAATAGNPIVVIGTSAPTIDIAKADLTHNGYLAAADFSSFNSKASGFLAAGNVYVGNASGVAAGVPFTGDVTLSNLGLTKVIGLQGVGIGGSAPYAAGEVLRYDGTSQYQATFLSMADIRSTVAPGTTIFPSTNCAASKALSWSSLTDAFTCQDIAISATQVSGLGTAAFLNVGVGSNSVVQLDSSSKLPAVDGSQLTNLNAGALASGTIDPARLPASAGVWALSGTNAYNTNAGFVGIGTTAPAAVLDLVGTPRFTKGLSIGGLAGSWGSTLRYLQVGNGSVSEYTGDPTGVALSANATDNGIGHQQYITNGAASDLYTTGGTFLFEQAASGTAGGTISWSYPMAINSSGNVGIGTTTPGYKLDVVGDINTSGAFRIAGVPISAGSANSWTQSGSSVYPTTATNVGIGTDAPVVAFHTVGTVAHMGGNVGIGTTAPSQLLDIASTGSTTSLVETSNTAGVASQNIQAGTTIGVMRTYGQTHATKPSLMEVGTTGGTGSLAFLTANGAERMRIDSTGNVGIGTTAPNYPFDVLATTSNTPGAQLTNNWSNNTAYASLRLMRSRSDAGTPNADFGTGIDFFLQGNASSVLNTGSLMHNWETSPVSAPSKNTYFSFNNMTASVISEKMRISSSGNVGIGTTAPAYKLDVAGQINSSTGFSIAGVPISAGSANSWTQSGSNIYPTTATNVGIGTDTPAVAFHTVGAVAHMGGSVGIGTTAPAFALDVVGDINSSGNIHLPQGGYLYLYGSQTAHSIHENSNNTYLDEWDGNFHFYNSHTSADMLTIQGVANYVSTPANFYVTAGNVGIGTTAPSQRIEIQGALGSPATSGTTQGGLLRLSQNVSNSVLDFGIGGAGFAWLQSTNSTGLGLDYTLALNPNGGNVGIGTTAPAYKLDVAGDINTSGAFRINGSAISAGSANSWTQSGSNVYPTTATNVGIGTDAPAVAFHTVGTVAHMGGSVGIGTTAPTSPLDVRTSTPGFTGISMTNTDSGPSSAAQLALISDSVSSQIRSYSSTGGNNFQIQTGANYFDFKNTNATGKFRFQNTGGTTQILLDAATGNVGVGVTTPSAPLTVAGDIASYESALTNSVRITGGQGGPGSTATANRIRFGGGGSNSNFFTVQGPSNIDYITINNGNVGIGTTAPGYKLDVAGQVNSATGFSIAGVPISASGSSVWALNGTSAYNTNSGFVGIGTDAPWATSTVLGGASFPSLTHQTAAVASWAYGTASSVDLSLFMQNVAPYTTSLQTRNASLDGTGYPLALNPLGGNVGIGTTVPGYKLDVAGDVNTSGVFRIAGVPISSSGANAWTQSGSNVYPTTATNVGIGTDAPVVAFHTVGTVAHMGGNVGIGTTNPAQKLDVNGNILIEGGNYITSSAGADLYLRPATHTVNLWDSTNAFSMSIANGSGPGVYLSSNGSSYLYGGSVGIGTTSPFYKLDVAGDLNITGTYRVNGVAIGTGGSSPWTTSGTSIYPTTLANNVGIGTTAPSNTLSVNGGADFQGNVLIQTGSNLNFAPTNGNTSIGRFNSPGGMYFRANGTQAMFIQDSTGYVGIGTTSPGALLDLSGSGQLLNVGDSSNNDYISVGGSRALFGWSNSTSNAQIQSGAGKGILFQVGSGSFGSGTNAMLIDPTGNVGIGTTNPGFKLDVAGSGNFQSLYVNGVAVGSGGSSPWTTYGANIANNNSGYVGIGTTAPATNLEVAGMGSLTNGVIKASTTGAYVALDPNNGLILNRGTAFINNIFAGAPTYFRTSNVTSADTYAMTLLGNGNVGIGTTAPGAALDISASSPSLMIGADPGSTTRVGAAKDSNISALTYASSIPLVWSHATSGANTIAFGGGQATQVAAQTIEFFTAASRSTLNGTEEMRIDSSGNVGIGTTNPGYKLDVAGSGNFQSLYVNGVAVGSGGSSPWTTYGANIANNNAGSVGIGTTAPTAKLQISDASQPMLTLTQPTINDVSVGSTSVNASAFPFQGPNEGVLRSYAKLNIGTSSNAPVVFGTNNAQRMTIDGSGNVAINTSNLNRFDVSGASAFGTYAGTSTAPANGLIVSGNVGIGTSNPLTKLNVKTATPNFEALKVSKAATASTTDFVANSLALDYVSGVSYGSVARWELAKATTSSSADGVLSMKFYQDNDGTGNNYTYSFTPMSMNQTDGTVAFPQGVSQLTTTTPGFTVVDGDTSAGQVFTMNRLLSGGKKFASNAAFKIGTYDTTSINAKTQMQLWLSDGAAANGAVDTQVATFNANGNVGIGTTAPTYKLDVAGDINTTGAFRINGTAISAGSANAWSQSGSNVYPTTATNVGIGTTAPGALLDVNGALNALTVGIPNNGLMGSTGSGLKFQTAATNQSFVFRDWVANPLMTIATSTGGVGIGTTLPTGKLSVVQTSAADAVNVVGYSGDGFKLDQYGTFSISGTLNMGNDSNVGYQKAYSSVGTLNLTSGNSSGSSYNIILKPSGSGNVGIGTTAPTAKLEVDGNAASTPSLLVKGASGQSAALVTVTDVYGNALFSVAANGKVSTGTVQTNDVALYGSTYYDLKNVGNDLELLNSSNGTIPFYAAASGNLGIGTTAPVNLLDIAAGGGIHLTDGAPSSTNAALYNVGGTLMWNGSAVGGGSAGIGGTGTANFVPAFTAANTVGNSPIYTSGGLVGIGTTAPISALTVTTNAAAGDIAVFKNTNSTGYSDNGFKDYNGFDRLYVGYGNPSVAPPLKGINYLQSLNSTDLAIVGGTGSTINAIFKSAGSVGIGTTTPLNTLDIGTNGGLHITAGTAPSNTTAALYNVGGTLMWNGSAVGGSSTAWSVNGSSIYNTTLTNNVGIGTTAPGSLLTVAGTAAATTYLASNGSSTAPSFALSSSTGTGLYSPDSASLSFVTGGNGVVNLNSQRIELANNISFAWSNGAGTYGYSKDLYMSRYAAGTLNFGTSGAAVDGTMLLGKIGVGGVTAPANAIDIAANGGIHLTAGAPTSTAAALYNVGGSLMWNGSSIAMSSTAVTSAAATGYLPQMSSGTGLANSILYGGTATRIGLNTSAPGVTLDVSGGAASTRGEIRVYEATDGNATNEADLDGDSTSGAYLHLRRDGGNEWFLQADPSANNNFLIRPGNPTGTPSLSISTAGIVGIGTTTPSGRFEVNSGAASAATGIVINTTSVGANVYEQYKANGTVIGSISSAAGASVAFNTTSDVRLKGGFQPVASPLKTLDQIDVTNFYYLADPTQQRMDGFKAQQLYSVVPYAVTKPAKDVDDKGKLVPWLADYSKVVPLVTAAVQELYHEVFGLSRDIASIKEADLSKDRRIEELEQQNAAMKAYLCSKDPAAPICK